MKSQREGTIEKALFVLLVVMVMILINDLYFGFDLLQ